MGPAYSAKVCLMAGTVAGDNITTSVNKGRWARPMSGLLLLNVYDLNPPKINRRSVVPTVILPLKLIFSGLMARLDMLHKTQ